MFGFFRKHLGLPKVIPPWSERAFRPGKGAHRKGQPRAGNRKVKTVPGKHRGYHGIFR